MNLLQTNLFKTAMIEDLGNLELTIVASTMPSISTDVLPANFRRQAGGVPSNRITYTPLTFSFIVQEDLKNYLEIFRWMRANQDEFGGKPLDIIMTLYKGTKMPGASFRFVNCFPTSLAGFEIDTQNSDTQYAKTTVEFHYDYFEPVE